jgi:hypothetical protein
MYVGVVLIYLTGSQVHAQNTVTAKQLATWCETYSPTNPSSNLCIGIISGIALGLSNAEGLRRMGYGCLPPNPTVDPETVMARYLRAHPNKADLDGQQIAVAAVAELFPCSTPASQEKTAAPPASTQPVPPAPSTQRQPGTAVAQQPKDDDERLTRWVSMAQKWIQESCSSTAAKSQKGFCETDVRQLRWLTSLQVCNAKHQSYVARLRCHNDAHLAAYGGQAVDEEFCQRFAVCGDKAVDEHFSQRLIVAAQFDRGELTAEQVEAEMTKYVPLASSSATSPMRETIMRYEKQAQNAPRGRTARRPGVPRDDDGGSRKSAHFRSGHGSNESALGKSKGWNRTL